MKPRTGDGPMEVTKEARFLTGFLYRQTIERRFDVGFFKIKI